MNRLPSKEKDAGDKPSPCDFDVYLPWACTQLQVEISVVIVRAQQNEYVSMALTDRSKSKKSKHKLVQSKTDVGSDEIEGNSLSGRFQNIPLNESVVKIYTTYDNIDNLIHIKFDKNKNIPRTVLKIIGLMVKFHTYLSSLTINRGLDAYSIHEICKILPKSNLTDICLDGTFLAEANYYLLLENKSKLRQLSLARCKIDDEVLKKLADNLVYPLPSSKTLCVLNVSSNRITDIGVKYLAQALRTNRQLAFINLADNMINDYGVSELLDVLIEFPITTEELILSRQRLMTYLNEKRGMVARMLAELRSDDKKVGKKKIRQSFALKKTGKGLEKEASLKALADLSSLEAGFIEKAQTMAQSAMGIFIDPFSTTNTISKGEIMFCCGNNALAYLNLAYNNISFTSLKKFMNVLMYQKLINRKPRGLINLCIEGNPIPVTCKELAQIDDILETGLMAHSRSYSVGRKRPVSRGK